MLTLRQIADLIGRLDGRSTDSTRKLLEQLRVLSKMELLRADSEGARGAKQHGLSEVCRARLYAVLLDFGLGATFLSHHTYIFDGSPTAMRISRGEDGNQVETPVFETEAERWYRIVNLPEAIQSGEDWVLRMELKSQAGRNMLSGRFELAEEVHDPEVETTVAKFNQFHGITVLGRIEIPVAKLCKPIVDAWRLL
ncbi:hypothetical protein [Oceanicaulis alexandrii]|uniref:hypothetical protein n=1 Tax=Oceanicaulis alexandrii TaxID=153233 RepID=UPI003B510910